MKKNKTIAIALSVLFASSLSVANEVSGKLVLENAGLNSGGMLKNEMKVKLYADGDITDNATYHVELQGSMDSAKVGGYSGEFTQNAEVRELYTDISGGDWDARIGKQQIVWGTADGMKLLDIINPTDYAEMAQDQMEDSRIPVWAVNLEKGKVQAVISRPKENVFAGLNRGTATGKRQNSNIDLTTPTGTGPGTDTGNAFLMMGPDSITGEVNGFLNIVPDLGSVAAGFSDSFGTGDAGTGGLLDFKHFTVDMFAGMSAAEIAGSMGGVPALAGAINMGLDGAEILAYFSTGDGSPTSGFNTNLTETASFDPIRDSGFTNFATVNTGHDAFGVDKDSAFEYMGSATFSTFDAFAMASSEYRYNMPRSDEADFALKYADTTKGGTNYSMNLSNSYDKNPIIDISWRGVNDEKLFVNRQDIWFDFSNPAAPAPAGGTGAEPTNPQPWEQLRSSLTLNTAANGSGQAYGMNASINGVGNEFANLVFEQSVVKTKNIGGSFDTSFNHSALGPVVVRGEALYTQDGKQPVVDKALFAIGDLPGALTMLDADRFKFVLGVDVTVLTNMLISTQYISDRNLDFIDGNQATGKYTTDYATMHLSNGFNKAIENKQYGSLFLSKPFGNSGQHRWNNITMLEQGTGEDAYWNRFDVSWGLSDDVEGTFELNNYWGNPNTQFGQLSDASNKQVGLKYSF